MDVRRGVETVHEVYLNDSGILHTLVGQYIEQLLEQIAAKKAAERADAAAAASATAAAAPQTAVTAAAPSAGGATARPVRSPSGATASLRVCLRCMSPTSVHGCLTLRSSPIMPLFGR